MKLLIIEGGIHGRTKNCGEIIKAITVLSPFEETEVVYLSEKMPLERDLCAADAYLLITGTYWDSCGSPMQKFIEDFTHLEADPRIAGKPVGVITLCHFVGGKSVLSRLQGVFSCMGFLIPPMSGVVLERDSINSDCSDDDSWGLSDIDIVLKNIHVAATHPAPYVMWKVNRGDFEKLWVDLEAE
jgi:flavodoxin